MNRLILLSYIMATIFLVLTITCGSAEGSNRIKRAINLVCKCEKPMENHCLADGDKNDTIKCDESVGCAVGGEGDKQYWGCCRRPPTAEGCKKAKLGNGDDCCCDEKCNGSPIHTLNWVLGVTLITGVTMVSRLY